MGWFSGFIRAAVKIVKEVAKEVVRDVAKYIFKELPKQAVEWWNGKKIAVIGATAVGKNCLYQRLKGEAIPQQHLHTRGAERVPAFTFRCQLPDGAEFKIYCKRSVNIGGETDERERYWFDACDDADVVFYMITLDDLRAQRYRAGGRVNDDLKWIVSILPRLRANTAVHFLVNKIDVGLNGDGYESFVTSLKPDLEQFEKTAKALFGAYRNRLTGISPTSMKDDHLFALSFPLALKAVHGAISRSKSRAVGASA